MTAVDDDVGDDVALAREGMLVPAVRLPTPGIFSKAAKMSSASFEIDTRRSPLSLSFLLSLAALLLLLPLALEDTSSGDGESTEVNRDRESAYEQGPCHRAWNERCSQIQKQQNAKQ